MDIVNLIFTFLGSLLGGAVGGALIAAVLGYFFDKKKYVMDLRKKLYNKFLLQMQNQTFQIKQGLPYQCAQEQQKVINRWLKELSGIKAQIALIGSNKAVKFFHKLYSRDIEENNEERTIEIVNIFRKEIGLKKCKKEYLSELLEVIVGSNDY